MSSIIREDFHDAAMRVIATKKGADLSAPSQN
jgi:hypothetical protein